MAELYRLYGEERLQAGTHLHWNDGTVEAVTHVFPHAGISVHDVADKTAGRYLPRGQMLFYHASRASRPQGERLT